MFSGNSFRPRFESLEARDQPTNINFYDLIITSYQAPPPEMSEGGSEVQSFSWGVTQTGTMAVAR